jgi:hypothetical protein
VPALARLRLDMPPLKAGRGLLEARRRRFHVESRPQELAAGAVIRNGISPECSRT